jgi:regulation of enolase protein 1 (concanavalin A-like superfamily)
MRLAAIPFELTIENAPLSVRVDEGRVLEIAAPGGTNLFNHPGGRAPVVNAPMVLFVPDADFVLSARVTADLKAVYDVAALVVYVDERTWAKLCFENSVEKQPTIVSVVTRGFSDDCNSLPVSGREAFLAVAKKGAEFSLHYSADGQSWQLIRHFRLETNGPLHAGFAVHGSVGTGIAATFSDVTYSTAVPSQMRKLPPGAP